VSQLFVLVVLADVTRSRRPYMHAESNGDKNA
jgi:hypothetical protein